MRLKLLSCEVFAREIGALLKESPHDISVQFFTKGLHETSCGWMRQHLQDAIDWTTTDDFDAILLAYGLCNYGIAGLKAASVPLVIPRAHDCITLLLGSRARYEDYHAEHPGAYFRSSGWLERRQNPAWIKAHSVAEKHGLNAQPADFEKFGDAAAKYLSGILCNQRRGYDQVTFIETGVEPDDRFEQESKREAAEHGWDFEKVRGDLRILRNLLFGEWNDEDFLVVSPGNEVRPSYNERIITLQKDP